MEPLTVCIIARDASLLLKDCLESVKGLTNQIIVIVDDRTTDTSPEIAKSYSAQVYIHPFTDFASQKNFALTQSITDWNLFLDTDERLSPDLITEIILALTKPKFDAFYLPRLNYIFNRPLHHTNWDSKNDSHIWLFKKSVGTWSGKVHEEVKVQGSVGQLKHPKIHLTSPTVEDFITKLNRYTSLETRSSSPFIEFIRRFFWHLGFLDGWHGLFLSYLMLIYHLSVGIKLWQKKNYS